MDLKLLMYTEYSLKHLSYPNLAKMLFFSPAVLPQPSIRVPRGPRLRPVRLLQRDLVHAVPGVLEEALGRDGLQVRHGRPEARNARRTETAFYGESYEDGQKAGL